MSAGTLYPLGRRLICWVGQFRQASLSARAQRGRPSCQQRRSVEQLRDALALIGMKQEELAEAARVSPAPSLDSNVASEFSTSEPL
jgi:hypothetical protein